MLYIASSIDKSKPKLHESAFIGIPKRFTDLFRKSFDPAVILMNLLVLISVYAGRLVCASVWGRPTYPNLYLASIGSNLAFHSLYEEFSKPFPKMRFVNASNVQNLLFQIRDPVSRWEKLCTEPYDRPQFQKTVVDEGESDKSVLWKVPDLLSGTTGNTVAARSLSSVLERNFAGDPIHVPMDYRSGSQLQCERPHVSVLTTASHESIAQAKRSALIDLFLFFLSERIDLFFELVESDDPDESMNLWRELETILPIEAKYFRLSSTAESIIQGVIYDLGPTYPHCAQQLVKVALIFALLDRAKRIEDIHAAAAAAVVRYSASVRSMFALGVLDPLMSKIEILLRNSPSGKTNTEINKSLKGKAEASHISEILSALEISQKVRSEVIVGPGRYATRWFWIGKDAA